MIRRLVSETLSLELAATLDAGARFRRIFAKARQPGSDPLTFLKAACMGPTESSFYGEPAWMRAVRADIALRNR